MFFSCHSEKNNQPNRTFKYHNKLYKQVTVGIFLNAKNIKKNTVHCPLSQNQMVIWGRNS